MLHHAMMTYQSKLGHFSLASFSETKSVTPQFFFIFGISNMAISRRCFADDDKEMDKMNEKCPCRACKAICFTH